MDLRQLKYFYTIAEEGQITLAAKKLNMAQPPLSQQLKLLEEELGVKLVERGARQIVLTEAGKILMNRARQILELSNSVVSELQDYSKGLSGTINIGTVSSSGAVLLNEQMLSFQKKHVGVTFEIYEGNTFHVIELLNKGVIEVGIVRTPFNSLHFECKYARKENMIAAIPPDFQSLFPYDKISVNELKNMPLILYRRFESLIYETCMENGFEPRVSCKNDDARTSLLWANAGLGIGIVPETAYGLVANHNLIMKVIDSNKLRTQVAAIWVKNRYVSPLVEEFIRCFGEGE